MLQFWKSSVAKKQKGLPISAAKMPAPDNVVNLMDAPRASLARLARPRRLRSPRRRQQREPPSQSARPADAPHGAPMSPALRRAAQRSPPDPTGFMRSKHNANRLVAERDGKRVRRFTRHGYDAAFSKRLGTRRSTNPAANPTSSVPCQVASGPTILASPK